MYNIKSGKSNGFDPIPDGRYTLKIDGVNVTPHTKDNEDGHRFELTFLVIDDSLKGRKVWDNIYLPWVTWKMYALLEAGASPLVSSENVSPEMIAAALQGLEVSGYLTTTVNNGKTRTNVSDYTPVEGVAGLDLRRLG